jgi:cytochrome P450
MQRLTQHPDKLEIALNEIAAALGDGLPSLTSLTQLPYAGMVLQEALRLHLPLRWLQRRALVADQIDGHPIPAGALVLLAVGLFHRDPDLWHNPEAFEPERFRPENVAQQHPCAWLPFGKGQRFCLGKDFAMMEGKLILAMTLQRFNFASVN